MTSGPGAAILGCAGTQLSVEEAAFFREADPFGFILFARNVDTPDQLRRLTGDLRNAIGRDALITVDQEGGRVQRLRGPHWRDWMAPLDQVRSVSDGQGADAAARSLEIVARIIAAELRSVGIDSNCAPCADIAGDKTHPFLRNRCLGADPATVAHNARAVADGLLAGGVVPVIKHLPGHGRATVDSHLGLPVADVGLEEAAAWDFAPFRALKDLPMGMTAHIVLPALGDRPATQNPAAIDLIRRDIGFDGLLMTDDLNMEALSGNLATRTAHAMAAGCDVALHCSGDRTEMESVVAAAGSMTPDAARRAARAMAARCVPDRVDIPALEAELSSLLTGQVHV